VSEAKRPDRVLNALQFALLVLSKEEELSCHTSTERTTTIQVLRELIGLRNAGRLVIKNEAQSYTDDDGNTKVVKL